MKATHPRSQMLLSSRLYRLAVLSMCIALTACSDDKKGAQPAQPDAGTSPDAALTGARGPGQSGVELSKTVGQIDDGEVRKLCEWNNQLAPQLQPSAQQLCMLMAVSARTPAECEAKLALCTVTGSTTPPPNDCSKVTVSGLSQRCADVSIEAYEACLLATVEARKQRFSELSCAQAGTTPAPETRPAPCLTWVDLCSDLAP